MKIKDVLTFFKELDKRIHFPVRVILTGGAASVLFGAGRVTQDIDFEVALKGRIKKNEDRLKKASKISQI